MKQSHVEKHALFKLYWHKIFKYFIVITLIGNGICALIGYWSLGFFYFFPFISFSVVFILFMKFYNAEVTIHDSDY